jgi:hypothetical protein
MDYIENPETTQRNSIEIQESKAIWFAPTNFEPQLPDTNPYPQNQLPYSQHWSWGLWDWSPRITRSLHNLAAYQPHSQRQKFSFLLLRGMLSTGCSHDQWMLPDDFPHGYHPHLISSQLCKLSSDGYFPREVWCCALRDSLCKHVLKVTLQGIWWEKLLSKRDLVFCAERLSLHTCAELCICKGFDVLHWEISVWKSTGCRLLDLLELILSALQTLVNFLFMSVVAYLYCSSNIVTRFEMASVSELFIANKTNLKTNCKQGI